MIRETQQWIDAADAFAFLGNSLLAPMTQTGDIGLTPDFWDAFPAMGDAAVERAIAACSTRVLDILHADGGVDGAAMRVSVEYTRLFVGPPRPLAAPWETFYRNENVTVGFGEATFEMRGLLRDAGLEVSNENNQYADHMGIELLFLSELCRDAAAGNCNEGRISPQEFANGHPLAWIGGLENAVEEWEPDGYFAPLLRLAHALLGVVVE